MTEPAPHAIDRERLAAWLRAHVEDCGDCVAATLAVEKFAGGQSNPTYRLTFGTDRADGGRRYVLRRKPDGVLLPSAHAVDREYRVIAALAGSDVPVARAHALCSDDAVAGTMFYVMDCVEGRTFWDPRLPELARGERAAIYAEMNRVIATLHGLDPVALGLADFGRPGNYFARQIARWSKQYRAAETETVEAMERLLAWLPVHVPAADETRLVHGDYRIDNLIFHPTEPRILAVVDWELATLGHPLADFAYHAMAWRLSHTQLRGLAGADLAALGIPDERAYLESYLRRSGRAGFDPAEWEFAIAYNMFRVACIRQGVLKRALEGNASNEHALEAGRKARDMAELAWRQVESM
jgi:aminoglycoside phosphotransferase (APT) family kinase protein